MIGVPGTVFLFISFFYLYFILKFHRFVPIYLYGYKSLLAHLVPTGTPGVLIPIIVIIETVRSIIRPGTLSVRLGANIIAGHLLLTLLGSQGPNRSMIPLFILFIGLILLLILEVGVSCIQSYVFTILSSLYLNELSSTSFNKVMTS